MDLEELSQLEKQRQRRKRVARIRKTILIGGAVIILLLIVTLILLFAKTVSLQKRLDGLTEQVELLAQAKAEREAAANEEKLLEDSLSDASALGSTYTDASEELYGKENLQKIYLTFDDGPSDYTEEILDVLDAHNVKATFFVIGKTDEASVAIYREIVSRGHTLGMHSYSHRYSEIYQSVQDFEEDLDREISFLEEVTGVRPWLYRFPGGSSNTVGNVNVRDLINSLEEREVSYCDWNVDSGDATNARFTAADFMANIEASISKYDTAVILMHDTNGKVVTRESLDQLLTTLEEREAELLPITEDSILVQHISAQ